MISIRAGLAESSSEIGRDLVYLQAALNSLRALAPVATF